MSQSVDFGFGGRSVTLHRGFHLRTQRNVTLGVPRLWYWSPHFKLVLGSLSSHHFFTRRPPFRGA